MEQNAKILSATRWVGSIVLAIGVILFFIGFLQGGLYSVAPLGLGLIMGAVFIFLIGMFLVIVEDMGPSRRRI